MRAATITSLVVLGLSATAIASVGAEGQRTKHHKSTSAMSNSTDMSSGNMAMNSTSTPDATAPMTPDTSSNSGATTMAPGDPMPSNGM